MLFESLDKLKRNSIMSSILLIFLGAIIIICPNQYIASLTLVFGYALVVISIIMLLNYFSSNKALMDYIKFAGGMILGLVGICVLAFRGDIMRVLAGLFGFLLILTAEEQCSTPLHMPAVLSARAGGCWRYFPDS